MAQFTIDIPDALIAQAEAAAQRINDRREVINRSPNPLTVDETQVRLIVIQDLKNKVLADAQEQAQIDTAAGLRNLARDLEAHK